MSGQQMGPARKSGYNARGSGNLNVSPYSHQPTRAIQKRLGSDPRQTERVTVEYIENMPPFDPAKRYTRWELTLHADKLLREHANTTLDRREHPTILFAEHYKYRMKREVYVGTGTPDPAICAGLYNRSHPEGRKLRNGAGFYR
jgi:hypothetical protein